MGTLIHCCFLFKKLTFHGQEAPSLHRSLDCQPQLFLHSMILLHQFHFFCVLRVQFAPKAGLLGHLDPKFHLSNISMILVISYISNISTLLLKINQDLSLLRFIFNPCCQQDRDSCPVPSPLAPSHGNSSLLLP